MSAFIELHHKAMELADEAKIAQARGSEEASKTFFEKAYFLEKEAVAKMPTGILSSIPRPVLIRSAAALAYKAKLYQESERMIALGVMENPPLLILEELEELAKAIENEKPASSIKNPLFIKGVLTRANADDNEIRVETANKEKWYSIFVPKNRLNEIVKNYWHDEVSIEATTTPHGVILLKSISKAA